jgi:nitroreductase
MMFQQLIYKRESIRNYDPNRPVEKEKLLRILNAGRLAPSAANRQPWKFYLISKTKNLERIRMCYNRDWFKKAPHVLVVAGFQHQAWSRANDGYNSIETDLTIAMDHMILAAEDEGVATCWIAAFDYHKTKATGFFEVDEVIFAITPLGYPQKDFVKKGTKDRKSLDEIVVFL